MKDKLWHYQARVVRVIDGDTLLVELDTGFHSTRWERLRLLGVDCPEIVGTDRQAGMDARNFVRAWVASDTDTWPYLVVTSKTDSFGRYLATITRKADGVSLADALIAAGHGVPA